MNQNDSIATQFEKHWPIIQGKLIERGFPLSKRNINYYKAAAFKEYVKNYYQKIVPEILRRNHEQASNRMYEEMMRQAQQRHPFYY